jgi:hypothetical protein
MHDPLPRGGEPRIRLDEIVVEHMQQGAPMGLQVGRHDQVPVGALEQVCGRRVGGAVAEPCRLDTRGAVVGQRSGLEVEGHVVEADPDPAPTSGPRSLEQGCQDPVAQRVTACRVDDREPDPGGRPVRGTRQRHHPALGLDDEVDAAQSPASGAPPEARDRRVDQPGEAAEQLLRPHPESVHHARRRRFHDDVRLGSQVEGQRAAIRCLEIDAVPPLAAVVRREHGGRVQVRDLGGRERSTPVAVRGFELEHLGAVVRQPGAGSGACDHLG